MAHFLPVSANTFQVVLYGWPDRSAPPSTFTASAADTFCCSCRVTCRHAPFACHNIRLYNALRSIRLLLLVNSGNTTASPRWFALPRSNSASYSALAASERARRCRHLRQRRASSAAIAADQPPPSPSPCLHNICGLFSLVGFLPLPDCHCSFNTCLTIPGFFLYLATRLAFYEPAVYTRLVTMNGAYAYLYIMVVIPSCGFPDY